MVTRFITAAVAVALYASSAGAGHHLPTWSIADICRGDSAPGQCRISESQAWSTIGSSWDLLPVDVRASCLDATQTPGDQNWRALSICIEDRVLRAKADRAIATASTPADPEPAQPVADPAAEDPAPTPAEAVVPAEPASTISQ